MSPPTTADVSAVSAGYDADPGRSMSLGADAYVSERWFGVEQTSVFARTWQWVCHVESVTAPSSFVTATIAGMPVVVTRARDGVLRAFYNVCSHRAHELVSGSGTARNMVCPYHAWTFDLTGELKAARRADSMPGFDKQDFCLTPVQVEEFGGFVYVNLDPAALPLAEQAGDLAAEIARWAPDVERLTHVRRLRYDVAANWKNVIDNFLEA